MTTQEIWANVLRGVAIGDAWGNPNEFQSIEALTASDRRGPNLPAELEVTDDTQMTLYLARALHETAGADIPVVQQAIADAYIAYTHDPDFASRAPGITVTNSLRRLESGLPWQDATDDHSDGCGTVMRVSPAAFSERWVGISAFSAALTHGTPNGVASAILNARILRYAAGPGGDHITKLPLTLYAHQTASYLASRDLETVQDWLAPLEIDLREGFATLERTLRSTLAVLEDFREDPWAVDPCEIGGGGWRAHECLATALLAVDTIPYDGWEALRRAVVTDGDSDSIGAVAGGLLGAVHGQFWPATVIERLEPRYQDWIAEADSYNLQ